MPSHRKNTERGVLQRVIVASLLACLAVVSSGMAVSAAPQDGVVSLAYTDGKYTLTLQEAKAWEVKLITPSPQEIVCGQNYGKPCTSKVYTFTSQADCVMVQVDWQSGSGYNSSDPTACKPTAPPEDDSDSKKVEFCHATGSESNPFVLIETSVNAFYQAGHDTHQAGRDIVPPFSYKKKGQTVNFSGLNWDATGQAIFKNGCEVPKPEPKCVEAIDTKDIEAKYTTDDFNASVKYTGKELCAGVSKTVSLNSYGADGPTWETSGTQIFVDHDQFTVDKDHTSGALKVKAPQCYYQTDLYWGSTRYDGVDGALPHYPDSWTPHNLIGSRNGGRKCDTPPPTPRTPTVAASADACVKGDEKTGQVNVTVTNTSDDTKKTVTYDVTLNGVTKQVTIDDGKSESVQFTGLAVGDYPISVKGDDDTTASTTVKVTKCDTPPPTKIDVPAQPTFEDPCGPNNASWNKPQDTDKVAWTLVNGHLIVTTKDGFEFQDGTTTHDFGTAPESGEECSPPPTKIDLPKPAFEDPCGPNNAKWKEQADTDVLTWKVDDQGNLIATIIKNKVTFQDGTTTHNFGKAPESGELCPPEIIINPKASVEVVCDGSGAATLDNSKSTTEVGFEVVVNGVATLYSVAAGKVENKAFSGAKSGSQVIVQDGEANKLASATVPDKCDTPIPPKPPTPPTESKPPVNSVLPDTGGAPLWAVGVGISLVLLGGAAVVAFRRKKLAA